TNGSWAVSGNNIYNTNTGNVGIGTNNPTSSAKTTIQGSATMSALNWQPGTYNAVGFLGYGTAAEYNTVGDNVLIGAISSSNANVIFRVSGSRMIITNNGKVGIGTTNPSPYAATTIVGDSNSNVAGLLWRNGNTDIGSLGFSPTNDAYISAMSSTGKSLILRAGGGDRITIAPDGKVTIPQLTGSGNDYVCVNSAGQLYRSNTAC
ncbi:MAG: hypothetical protein AABW81_01870, partial [Nanoarchaeota archaeon]